MVPKARQLTDSFALSNEFCRQNRRSFGTALLTSPQSPFQKRDESPLLQWRCSITRAICGPYNKQSIHWGGGFSSFIPPSHQISPFLFFSQMEVVELRCAGGATLSTTSKTLARAPFSRLAAEAGRATEDSPAHLVALLLDALRREDMRLVVPEGFDQWGEFSFFSGQIYFSRRKRKRAIESNRIQSHPSIFTCWSIFLRFFTK